MRPAVVVFLVFLLTLQFISSLTLPLSAQTTGVPDVYVGVDMAYGDSVAEAKRQIDEVAPYTNLFILGCKGITSNTARLNETCQYIADKGLDFIVYRDTPAFRNASSWPEMAKKTWEKHFLGYYAYDEIGGWQIDMQEWIMVPFASNYTEPAENYAYAATSFVNMSHWWLDRMAPSRNTTQFDLYTSDYALYWFDYAAGYDTVFAEFGWNYSRLLNIALCRGAANMHGKDWGAMLTWTYKQPPYLESDEDLYRDMVLAYDNGAKYIIVFDANEGWTQSVLTQDHLGALKRFWNYAKSNPRKTTPTSDRVAYVLPKDYGYGFRGPDDKIWGFWQADNLTDPICSGLSQMFTKYGEKLDIIYDYGLSPGDNLGYSKLIYWNDSSLKQPAASTDSPTDPLWPSQTETETPSASPSTTPIETPSSPTDYTLGIVAAVTMAVVAVPAVMFRKRQHCITFAQSGVGRDFAGTVVVVDGKNYDRYGSSFWWDHGSTHTFEFKSPLKINGNKQYVLISTNGASTNENDVIKARMEATVTGNYQPVLKTGLVGKLYEPQAWVKSG